MKSWLMLVLVAAAACGADYPSGKGMVDGMLGGETFDVGDVVFAISPAESSVFGGHPSYLTIKVTTFAHACQVANDQIEPKSSRFLTLYFSLAQGMPAEGTYMIGANNGAFSADYGSFDDTCKRGSAKFSTGSITITKSTAMGDSSHVRGDFAATFQLGYSTEQITGDVDAAPCGYGWYVGGGGACTTP